MAVVVGTAQGKLTLDASKFITNIDSSYKALKNFYDLIEDTQTALKKLPSDTKLNIDIPNVGSTGNDSGGFFGNTNREIDDTIGHLDLLKDALKVGVTGALEGVGALAEATFSGFKQYTDFVVNFSKESLTVGQQFDATMSQVGAISGATDKQLEELRKTAIDMGAQTKFSASEAAQAMVYMGMAAWETDDIVAGIPGVMSLAAASGEDLATTSDILTDSLTAFGLEAKDATMFADVLAAAATNSNTNVALMGETFKYVAPLAGTMKYNVKDTAIAIGLMANSGIKGSQAGTALRNVISNLASPTEKVSEAMDALGLSLVNDKGETKSLMQLMQDLRATFKGLNVDPQMISALNELDEQYAEGAISSEEYEEATKALEEQFLGSMETIQAKYASAISGKYGLSGLLAIVNASDEDFQKLTESIYGASDGMGAAADMEQKMMDNLTGSVTIFKSTLETFQITISDLLKGPANEIVKFGQKSIADMTTAMKNEGIPGLIKAVGSIIPEFVKLIIPIIPQVLPSLIEGFWALVNGFIDAIPEAAPILISAAFDLFMGLTTGLNDAVEKLLPMLPDIIDEICTGIDDNADVFLDAALNLFLNIIEAAIQALPRIIKSAANIVKQIAKTLNENKGRILNMAIDLLLAIVEGLTDPDTIESLITAVFEIISLIIDTFSQTDWLEVADKIFAGLGKGLLGIFEGALGAIDDLLGTDFRSWGKAVGDFFSDLRQKSAEFGWNLAQSMHKDEIELNQLGEQYADTFDNFRKMYADLVKQGIDAKDAMAQAYQTYVTGADAQYYFRERMAGDYVKDSIIADQLGSKGWSTNQLIDMLTTRQVATGNTYNFYSPKVIDEKEAADQIKQTNEELLLGAT